MEKVTDYLKQFGLSELESKLYLGLLETGPTTVLEIAKHTGIKRTTAHVNIETLIEKGLVAQTKSGTRRKILAEEPEKLQYILEQRKLQMKSLETGLPGVLSLLTSRVGQSGSKASEHDVKYFEGKAGIQKVYQEAFSSSDLRSYVNLGEADKTFPENTTIYLNAHKGKKDFRLREIIDGSPDSLKKASSLVKDANFDYKIANFEVSLELLDILIYEDKVAIINFKDRAFASIIDNKEYAKYSKEIFDYIWRTLPESK